MSVRQWAVSCPPICLSEAYVLYVRETKLMCNLVLAALSAMLMSVNDDMKSKMARRRTVGICSEAGRVNVNRRVGISHPRLGSSPLHRLFTYLHIS